MATADLPKEFDVIVLGTGMPESIVAAAFSRIGQSVLHLDRNEHYSGGWASFNLQGIEKWTEQHLDESQAFKGLDRPAVDVASLLQDGESLIELPLDKTSFSNAEFKYYVKEEDQFNQQVNEGKNTSASINKQSGNVDDSQCLPTTETSSTIQEQTQINHPEQNISEVPGQIESDQDVASEIKDLHLDDSKCDIPKEDGNGPVENKPAHEKDEEIEKDNTSSDTGDGSGDVGNKTDPKEGADNMRCPKQGTMEQDADGSAAFEKSERKCWTVKRLKAEWRKFNLDLSPKVLYSVGDMVSLLISSDIAKYCEFKTVTQILTVMDGNLEKVPCSRADVFSSKKVSMIEKRMLMKFLQYCQQYEEKPEELADFLEKPFSEFLTFKKLTPTIKHYVQHSITMATDSMTTKEGLEKMKKFLKSLGRYGNTSFLWSLYGSGELPQSFCRMCAVFGGVYCLRMSAASVVIGPDNRCDGIITTDGQRIKCKWLIMEGSYAPASFLAKDSNTRTISRAIIVTDRPLLTTDQQELSLMNLPCVDDCDRPVSVLELPPSSMACPSGTYVYHLTRKGKAGVKPQEDLQYAVSTLFSYEGNLDENKPSMLWSLYFCQQDLSVVLPSNDVPENVVLMTGPGVEMDIDRPVQEAKDVFKRILPEEEFLPKAPNPEDIIYVDDAEAQIADSNSQSEFSETDQSENSLQKDNENEQLDSIKDSKEKDQSKSMSQNDSEAGQSECSSHGIKETDQSECEKSLSNQSGDDSGEAACSKESV